MLRYARKNWHIAGWTFFADIYCYDCGEKFPEVDSEGNDRHPIFDGQLSEFDPEWNDGHASHCGECGLPTSEW